jgi:uncharacterized membrane protein
MIRIILIATLLLLSVSCNNAKKETAAASTVPCTSSSPDHWTTGVSAIVQSNCTSCHSTYSTFAGAKTAAAGIASQVDSGAMPQGTALSAADKASLVQWAACGTPE